MAPQPWAQASGQHLAWCGKEPREVSVGSSMLGPPSPPKGELPRLGLVVSFFGPPTKYHRAQHQAPKRYRAQQKGSQQAPCCP